MMHNYMKMKRMTETGDKSRRQKTLLFFVVMASVSAIIGSIGRFPDLQMYSSYTNNQDYGMTIETHARNRTSSHPPPPPQLIIGSGQGTTGTRTSHPPPPLIIEAEKGTTGTRKLHPPPPLIIGAGQGTTGTRTIHEAICCLGIPSLHFGQDCIRLVKKWSQCVAERNIAKIKGGKDVVETPEDFLLYDEAYERETLGALMALGVRQIRELAHDEDRNSKLPENYVPHSHLKIVWRYKEMNDCLDSEKRTELGKVCPPPETKDMAVWVKDVKDLIDDVIRWHEDDPSLNIGAIHDSPYPMAMKYVIESAKKHRGSEPLILLSERDPIEWSLRRTEKHEVILCRIDLIDGFKKKKEQPPTSHFDWFECIERTIRAKKKKNPGAKVGLYDVFTSYANLVRGIDQPEGFKWKAKKLEKHLAVAFEKEQNLWKARSDLTINMFEKSTTALEIALDAHKRFSSTGAFRSWKKNGKLKNGKLKKKSAVKHKH